jgi:hypothetical protein
MGVQVANNFSDFLKLDLTAVSPTLLAAAIIGFPLTLIFSWFYQVTPSGITRTLPFVERRVLGNLAPLDDRRKEERLYGRSDVDESAYDWILEMESGPLLGKRYGVEGTIVVGRSLGCELTIPVLHISREHARFIREGSQLLIEDLGSANGTAVNGVRIDKVVSLSHQDTVQILDVIIRIKESPAHAIAHAQDTTVVQMAMLPDSAAMGVER